MKLATFLPPGGTGPVPGEIRGEWAVAFDDGSTVLDRLATGDHRPASGPAWPLAEIRFYAPVPRPGAIYGIGLNYRDHASETGGAVPEQPIVFMMPPTAAAPPAGPIVCPEVVRRLDYEGELAIVMGAGGAVGGYAVANDVSARDLQRREPQWTRAKGADTFCPYGPWVTTVDEVPDPQDLWLRTWVNGELRQDARTSDLIFGVDELVGFLGQAISLQPGDLILTGTPSGVGMAMDPPRFLQSGDVIAIEIEGLGRIQHAVA